MNLKTAEKNFIDRKKLMSDMNEGKIHHVEPPVKRESIYAQFMRNAKKSSTPLIKLMEAEILRNIQTYEPVIASKRITELIWVSKYEW